MITRVKNTNIPPMQIRISAKGNSISIWNMPMVVAFSNDSLTSTTMWINTVESSTPPPKHSTNPALVNHQSEYTIRCFILPMNFLRNLSLFLFKIFVKTRGAKPLKSLIIPISTRTIAFIPVRFILRKFSLYELSTICKKKNSHHIVP